MEGYILDDQFRRKEVIDDYESFIWTERFNGVGIGDFEMDLRSTPATRALFVPEVRLACNLSYYVQSIETVEDKVDDDGTPVLNVKGRTIEKITEDRIIRKTLSQWSDPTYVRTGKPADLVRGMFKDICVDGLLFYRDVLPFLQTGTLFPPGNIPEPPDSITIEQKPDVLFNAMQTLCDQYDLGFRLVRNFDKSQLYWEIYTGTDRTRNQNAVTPVVFSPDLDNLTNTTELSSVKKGKNVAYVYSKERFDQVFLDGFVDQDVAGFDRRVILVDATDLPLTTDVVAGMTSQQVDEANIAEMRKRGLDELSKFRGTTVFDGEINQNSGLRYGVDYALGDLVEVRNVDGISTQKRVTEQIFVSDAEGERSYPTLTATIDVGTGTT